MRFRAVVVSGNRAGKIGVGVATGRDVQMAVEKATRLSKKYIIEISIVEDSIPHEVISKFGAAKVLLRPQKKGRGLVAGGTVRIICNLAGIKNISSKILGRTGNKLNNVLWRAGVGNDFYLSFDCLANNGFFCQGLQRWIIDGEDVTVSWDLGITQIDGVDLAINYDQLQT